MASEKKLHLPPSSVGHVFISTYTAMLHFVLEKDKAKPIHLMLGVGGQVRALCSYRNVFWHQSGTVLPFTKESVFLLS